MAIDPVRMSGVTNYVKKALNNPTISKVVSKFEPTGANNSFYGLVALMLGFVILPRVKTAAQRNPDDKEATQDEIKEILFRDIQTVVIMLLALKSIDALVGRLASKVQGLPLTNKPFRRVFASDPNLKLTDRFKNFFANIGDVINPVGGMIKYSNDDIVKNYSNFGSIEEVQKLFKEIPKKGGNNEKVFNKIINNLIESQEKLISSKEVEKTGGIDISLDKAKEILEKLKSNKDKGWKVINDTNIDADVSNKIVEFFKDKNNALVSSGKKVSALLKTFALGIEVAYLGFGLPALNQKRLEKKYLSGKDKFEKEQFYNAAKSINSSILVEKTIKPQEIALYGKFIK